MNLTLRSKAQHYFLLIIISAALTIIATRIFLDLTRYPQIAGFGLHIAHVLWGGLALLIACYLAVLYKGRNVLNIVSILGGIGWGLFIDEVGKFITANNDYFYKPAAPLIYITFLLNILYFFYIQKKSKVTNQTKLNEIMETIEFASNRKLPKTEYLRLKSDLDKIVKSSKNKNEISIAKNLLNILDENGFADKKTKLELAQEFAEKYVDKIVKNKNFLKVLNTFLAFRIFSAVLQTFILIAITIFPELTKYELWEIKQLENLALTETIMFYSRNVLSLIVAIIIGYSLLSKNKRKLDLIQIALLLNIAAVDIFSFYFDQFSTAIFTIVDIGLILLIERYQNKKA